MDMLSLLPVWVALACPCCSPRYGNARQHVWPVFWWCSHSLSRGISAIALFRLLLHCSVGMGCTRQGIRLGLEIVLAI